MDRLNKKQRFVTACEYEHIAQECIRNMLLLCEKRIYAGKPGDSTNVALARATLSAKHAIEVFLVLVRLHGE